MATRVPLAGSWLIDTIELLTVHTYIENEVMYPRVRDLLPVLEDDILESYEEHHVADVLVMELASMNADDERFNAKTNVLIENVTHHMKEEEEDWFPKGWAGLGRKELQELGQELLDAKKKAPHRPSAPSALKKAVWTPSSRDDGERTAQTAKCRTRGLRGRGRRGQMPSGSNPATTALTELSRGSWIYVVRRSVIRLVDDGCGDKAAALTYYSVLSIFPALIAVVSLVGLVGEGPRTVQTLLDIVGQIGADSAVNTVEGPLTTISEARRAAGFALIFGLVGALWSASAYVGAFGRSVNEIYGVEEGRPFWKLRPYQILITVVVLALTTFVVLGLVMSGPLVAAIGETLQTGSAGCWRGESSVGRESSRRKSSSSGCSTTRPPM